MTKFTWIICTLAFTVGINKPIFGQTINKNKEILIELVPFFYMSDVGMGIQVGYTLTKGAQFDNLLTYGVVYDYFNSAYPMPFVNGEPIAELSTESTVFDKDPYPFFIPDQTIFNHYREMGFKHFKPFQGYRINHFLTYEFLYHTYSYKKVDFGVGLGATLGLTMTESQVGAYNQELAIFGGDPHMFWIEFNMRSRYLYYGATQKAYVGYRVGQNLTLGVSAGLQYLFAKNFMQDDFIPYIGALIKVGIVK